MTDCTDATELVQRFRSILTQLETGDYATASDNLRGCGDEASLGGLPDLVARRIQICIMDARAELIHMAPDAAHAQVRQALSLVAVPA